MDKQDRLKLGVKIFADLIDERGIDSLAVKQSYALACKNGNHKYLTAHLEGIASGCYNVDGEIAIELISKYKK